MGMMLPRLNAVRTRMDGITAFAGYNHNLRIRDNEFFQMKNISSDSLPVITARGKRGRVRKLTKPNGIFAHDALCWVDGTGFFYNGKLAGQVTDDEKQFVRMGAYVLIWPDEKYYNTQTGEFGTLGAKAVSTGTVTAALCRYNGEVYATYTVAQTAPEKPENGDYWLDTSKTPNVLRQYSNASAMWMGVPTVYTRISAAGIGAGLSELDGVSIAGMKEKALNGSFYLVGRGDDYIVITALVPATVTQQEAVTVERKIPQMDFVTECDNRIWGCSSKNHEIYACTLGDPKNWNAYLQQPTDSYAVTVGSSGDFTGATAHMGNVLFLKENCIHQIMGTKPANYQLDTTGCMGVGKGNEKSVCTVNEMLLYRSVSDVCAYGSALPSVLSAALGNEPYKNAAGGALGNRYYLCMEALSGEHVLFAYDIDKGIWCKEDDLHVLSFATLGSELYMLAADGTIWSANGNVANYADAEARAEEPVQWMLETGDMGIDAPCSKYITGIQLFASVDIGTTLCVSMQYDAAGGWAEVFRSAPFTRRSVTLPIVSRRCRTLKIRISGCGGFQLYSIMYKTEAGSDVYGAR